MFSKKCRGKMELNLETGVFMKEAPKNADSM
jgi:hypothetical protein